MNNCCKELRKIFLQDLIQSIKEEKVKNLQELLDVTEKFISLLNKYDM